jgi:hypothetical protein
VYSIIIGMSRKEACSELFNAPPNPYTLQASVVIDGPVPLLEVLIPNSILSQSQNAIRVQSVKLCLRVVVKVEHISSCIHKHCINSEHPPTTRYYFSEQVPPKPHNKERCWSVT